MSELGPNSALGRCRLNVRVTPDSGGVGDTCPKTSDDGVTTNYVWEAKVDSFFALCRVHEYHFAGVRR